MERREALRLLATAVAIPLIPGELLAMLRTARAEIKSPAALRTLNPQQNAIVVHMAEVILPETETPGATTARVNEFIDLILTEWYSPEERTRFLAGLADADSRAQTRFGKAFAESSPEQQAAIVKDLDLEMVAALAEQHDVQEASGAHPRPQDFYASMKQLTLTGYFTSEVGAKQELHFKMIPGHYDACVPGDANTQGK